MEKVVGELNGKSCDCVVLQKEELGTPMPYCLHHNMKLKASTLEVKHCSKKGCSHLVFVTQVWTAPKKEVK